MRALLYPPDLLYPRISCTLTTLPPACFSVVLRLPAPVDPLGEHYVQALVMRVSFFWGSLGGASHISVIVVKFLTVPLNRQIKVLYHGIESISR